MSKRGNKSKQKPKTGLGKAIGLPPTTGPVGKGNATAKKVPAGIPALKKTATGYAQRLKGLTETEQSKFAGVLSNAMTERLEQLTEPDDTIEDEVARLGAAVATAEKSSALSTFVANLGNTFAGATACKDVTDALASIDLARQALDDVDSTSDALNGHLVTLKTLGTIPGKAKTATDALRKEIQRVRPPLSQVFAYKDVDDALKVLDDAQAVLDRDASTISERNAETQKVKQVDKVAADADKEDKAVREATARVGEALRKVFGYQDVADALTEVANAEGLLDKATTTVAQLKSAVQTVKGQENVARDASDADAALRNEIKRVGDALRPLTPYTDVVASLAAVTTAEGLLDQPNTTIQNLHDELIKVTNAYVAFAAANLADTAVAEMNTAVDAAGSQSFGLSVFDNVMNSTYTNKIKTSRGDTDPASHTAAQVKANADLNKAWHAAHLQRGTTLTARAAAKATIGLGDHTWGQLVGRFPSAVSPSAGLELIRSGDVDAGFNAVEVKLEAALKPERINDAVAALKKLRAEVERHQEPDNKRVKTALETIDKLLSEAKGHKTGQDPVPLLNKLEPGTKTLRDVTLPLVADDVAFRKKVNDAEITYAPLLKIQTLNTVVKNPLAGLTVLKNQPEPSPEKMAGADAVLANIARDAKEALDQFRELRIVQARAERVLESDLVKGKETLEKKTAVEKLIEELDKIIKAAQDVFETENLKLDTLKNAVTRLSKDLVTALKVSGKAPTDFDTDATEDTVARDGKRWEWALREVGEYTGRLQNVKNAIVVATREPTTQEQADDLLERCVAANADAVALKIKLDLGSDVKPLDQLPDHLKVLASVGAEALDLEQAVKGLGSGDDEDAAGRINAISYSPVKAKSVTDCFDGPSLLALLAKRELDDQHAKAKDGVIPVNTPLHRHLSGGSAGMAFAYVEEDDGSITPRVYDFAPRRDGNKYAWQKGGLSSGPPKIP